MQAKAREDELLMVGIQSDIKYSDVHFESTLKRLANLPKNPWKIKKIGTLSLVGNLGWRVGVINRI